MYGCPYCNCWNNVAYGVDVDGIEWRECLDCRGIFSTE